MMARYNSWQNAQLIDILDDIAQDDIYLDRGAFFGSIFGTLNHVLWADTMWLSRFGDFPAPHKPGDESANYCADVNTWMTARRAMDATILDWTQGLTQADLDQDMTWMSALSAKTMTAPVWKNVVHLFNHQTHHRGQVHAMLTQSENDAPVTDIPFIPAG